MKFKGGRRGGSNPHVVVLKSGELISGVLRGDPLEYEHAFNEGDRPKFRFKLNIVVAENGALVAKILEGGWKLYKQLKEINDAGWDLEKSYVRISRQGSMVNDTVYSATVLPTQVPAETLLKVSQVKLHELHATQEEPQAQYTHKDDPGPTDEIPF